MPNHEPTVETPFRIVDKRGRQAFSFSTSRPSVLHCGQVIPPTARNSHDPATYLIFNDENGDERGGLLASASQTSFSLDYPNCEAVTVRRHRRASGDGWSDGASKA